MASNNDNNQAPDVIDDFPGKVMAYDHGRDLLREILEILMCPICLLPVTNVPRALLITKARCDGPFRYVACALSGLQSISTIYFAAA
ncbi:hypothetical protein F5Y16DRAFT_402978 [Xylariaceae sp. FL0255]|nr:hypothetical protein F5Y16DRAFT_402978 [Xylariaceae sp. FL0255]